MKQSKINAVSSQSMSDEELEAYYKDSAMESLLYWANSTTQLLGANATLTFLTEMLATGIEMLVPPEQVSRAEDTIFGALDDAFTVVKATAQENSAKVSVKKSDKDTMN